jgi:PAS domain S-box-containing protein
MFVPNPDPDPLNWTAALARERAAELEAILDSLADAVFVVDAGGRVVDANAGAVRLVGAQRKDEALRPFREHWHRLTASGGAVAQSPDRVALRGEPVRGWLRQGNDTDGREVILDVSATPVSGLAGTAAGAVIVVRDVTELEWGRARAAVARVATAVARALGRQEMVAAVLAETAGALAVDAVCLYELDASGRRLALVDHRNMPPELVPLVQVLALDAPALTAQAVRTGEVQVIEDLSRPPADLLIPRACDRFGGAVAVPLRVRSRTTGAILCVARRPRRYLPHEIETVTTIGDIAAVGLENARLYDQAQAERRRFLTVIEHSPEGIVLFEPLAGRVVLSNRATERLAGQLVPCGPPL